MGWKEILNKRGRRKKAVKQDSLILYGNMEKYMELLKAEMNYRLFLTARTGEPLLWVEEIQITDFVSGGMKADSGTKKKQPVSWLKRLWGRMKRKIL